MTAAERMHTTRLTTRQLSVTVGALAAQIEASRGPLAREGSAVLVSICAQHSLDPRSIRAAARTEMRRPWWKRRR